MMESFSPSESQLDKPIRGYVTKRLIGVNKDTSIKNGVKKMVEFNISSLVVTDNGEVIGFFTDADIKERVVARGISTDLPVSEIMTEDLITVDISTRVRNVLEIMSKSKIKHVLVTEKNKIVGIITFRDLKDMDRQKLETYISRE